MKNIGKIFEEQIKKSVPEYALIHRLPDSAQSFGGNSTLRFSNKSPFDYILYNSKSHLLYALELKTVNGKSITFERTKEDKGEIHFYQTQALNEWDKYDGIVSGFLIEFRAIEKTVFIPISEFNNLISMISKKSFNFDDLDECGINCLLVSQERKRTRYLYDIETFLIDSEKYGGKKNV